MDTNIPSINVLITNDFSVTAFQVKRPQVRQYILEANSIDECNIKHHLSAGTSSVRSGLELSRDKINFTCRREVPYMLFVAYLAFI